MRGNIDGYCPSDISVYISLRNKTASPTLAAIEFIFVLLLLVPARCHSEGPSPSQNPVPSPKKIEKEANEVVVVPN